MSAFRIEFGSDLMVDLADQEDYEFPHPIQRWVLPVVPLHQEVPDTGSAFLLAPGLALTAAHVITHLQEVADPRLEVVFVSDVPVPGHEGPWGGLIDVTSVSFSEGHDLAILSLNWGFIGGQPFRCAVAPISVKMPEVGEPVLALGYTRVEVSVDGEQVEIRQTVTACRGTVEEVLPEGRDRLLVHFPAARGPFPAPGGMSGGPVLDSHGKVFGLVSRSLAPFEEGEPWASYVALLEPVVDMPVRVSLDGVEGMYSIRELARRGAIPHDGSL